MVSFRLVFDNPTLPENTDGHRASYTIRWDTIMQLLQSGVDRTIIALWLGHESVETTQVYIHADIELKEKAMALTKPVNAPDGRYRPGDELLSFLEAL